MAKIVKLESAKILDSRGEWTLRTSVFLHDKTVGIGEVPSGISTGKHEAALLPVDKAVVNVNEKIAPQLKGLIAENQERIDQALIELDGTENKSQLGANAILSVSLAVCDAAAKSQNLPLYKYISSISGLQTTDYVLPSPMLLMLEGGKHAKSERDFQEYMICLKRTSSYEAQLEIGTKIYHSLKGILNKNAFSAAVGVEGGFWPQKLDTIQAFSILENAIATTKVTKGVVGVCLDIAANSFSYGETYKLSGLNQVKNSQELLTFYRDLKNQFPSLFSLEDPFSENDLDGWRGIKKEMKEVKIVADDLTVTNPKNLGSLSNKDLFNSVIVKPNQIGTLSETLEFAAIAKGNGLELVVSHRAGETNSTFITDLAVGIGAEYVKFGAPARGERVAKYNRLLEIERELEGS